MKGMTFGKKAALALTGVSGRQLEHWAAAGIIRPSVKSAAGKGSRREYSFQDLVALKLAKRLRDEGISLQKIRKSLAWLRRHPWVTALIVGVTRLEHIDEAVAALDIELSEEEILTLEEPYVPHRTESFPGL